MRILHILDHSIPLHSGYTFRTLAILNEQRRLHWETIHVTSPKQENCRHWEETIEGWHFYRTLSSRGRLARMPLVGELVLMKALAGRLEDIVQRHRPDILHAHSPVLNAIPAMYVGRKWGIPVVYEVRAFWEDAAVDHGTAVEGSWRYRATRALETWVYRRVGHVTTICEGLRNDIIGRGIPATKVTVIPNAVDIGQFSTGKAPDPALLHRLDLADARVLGFIGSFYAYEGLPLLLESLPLVLARTDKIKLLLVGGGPQAALLKQLAEERGIGGKVIFTGRVPHAEVQRYYDLIDVLVYPRLAIRLTELVTPLKPLEAMAQGRLVVASDVGGHRELIRDGETGILFRAGDATALAAGILGLLDCPQRWPKLKTAARRFVESERNWPGSVARYRPVYAAVLGRNI
ncbi:MAG: TIGR04063 family PEP-CTERM/XrtA system glycosyltransferase [Candidatus Competibacteraceae bacterium]